MMALSRQHRDHRASALLALAAALVCGTAQPALGQSVAPFQMLSSDLAKYAGGAAVPGPFQVTQADVQAATEFSSGATASGPLTQNTGETVIFTGTGSGGAADIINNAGGATRFYDNSTAGTAQITNNGALQFSGNASGGQAQIVTNAGAVTVFTDTATAGVAALPPSGPSLTNNGLTIFLDQSSTGDGKLTNNLAGELHLAGDSRVGGALENSGLVVLSDRALLGNGFVVNNGSGSMLLRDNASAGDADIANSGTLVFAGASTADSAAINNNQTGVVAFIGSSNAGSGSQITNDGRLYFGDSASAAQAIINTQAGGQTIFHGAADGGVAALKVDSGGLLDISLLDTAGLSLGALIGDAAGAGSVIALGGKVLTLGSTNQSTMVAGLRDGGLGGGTGGSLVKLGTGELELAGTNSYTGSTRVQAGRLKAASAGAFAPLSGVVVAAGAQLDIGAWDQTIGALAGAGNVILGNAPNRLTIGTNDQSSTFSGALQADGGIIKVGTGTLTLSGTSTNTGDSRVEAGTLRVDGSLVQSPLTVAGGTLAGSGSVGQTRVLAGGTINPGGGSNLTIASDLLLDAGAIYRLDITGAGSDSLTVAGNASLGGARLVLGSIAKADPSGSYVILTAATTSGQLTFEPFDYAFLLPELDQASPVVTLTIARNGLRFSDIAQTPNQRAAATALEGLAPTDPVFAALLTANAGAARRLYELADGEVHAAAAMVSQQAFEVFSTSLVPGSARRGVVESATPGVVRNGWIAPLGGVGSLASDGNGAQVDWSAAGLAAGFETVSEHANGHTIVGVGLGTVASQASIDARLSSLAGEGFYGGLYGQWREGPLWLEGTLAYGANHVSTNRTIEIGGLSRMATADYWTQTLGASLQARYEFEVANGFYLGPVAAVDAGWSGHGEAMESGAGSLNQTIAPAGQWRLDTGIGLAARYDMPLEHGASLAITGKALWQHGFGDSVSSQTVALEGGGGPFTVAGPDAGRDRLGVVAGIEYRPQPDIILSLDYAATLGGPETSHAARLALRVKF